MKTLTPLANRKRKELIKDPMAYVDTIPKEELPELERMLQPEQELSTIRLFIGATENMPVRALGYLASAARIAELLPVNRLQVVSVAHFGSQVNGVSLEAVQQQFKSFARLGKHVLGAVNSPALDILSFVEDQPEPCALIEDMVPLVEAVLGQNPNLHGMLLSRGGKHGGDFVRYAAAHVAFQDVGGLEVQHVQGAKPSEGRGIVSVGCLQEKLFYSVRTAVRLLLDPEQVVPSVQIFTRHASAPYFTANGGEQMLSDAAATRTVDFSSNNMATARDLAHLQQFLRGGSDHEK